jgi:hypothetical protein
MEKKEIHFIGFLANVDNSILKLDLGQPFTIKEKSRNEVGDFLCHFKQDYGLESDDGIIRNQSFCYYCITANNVGLFESTPPRRCSNMHRYIKKDILPLTR